MRSLIAALLLLAIKGVSATTLPQISLADLYAEADLVALIDITEGQLLGEGPASCGARYRARVREGLKGIESKQIIEFGPLASYEIGGRYVVFLTRVGRSFEPKSSTSEHLENEERAIVRRCEQKWRFFRIMHHGSAALPVKWSRQFQYEESVRIRTEHVGLPGSIVSKSAELPDDDSSVWVRLEALLVALRELKLQ